MDVKTPLNVKMLKLKSSDSQIFEVEEVAATRCQLIKRMVEDGCGGEIPIFNVDGKTLTKLMEWCKKHAGDLGNKKEYEEWKTKFMDMEIIHELYDVLVASNFLELDLLDWCCVKVADLIKGKTPEEIRNVFKIVNDFTPEEEEEIRKKNYWALGDRK
ncbi:SKP1-like 11 [Euphorbia peplus]|nr:SKP1-like 11 [Euphorbia peplus]